MSAASRSQHLPRIFAERVPHLEAHILECQGRIAIGQAFIHADLSA